jgi:hypothetical protein
MYTAARQLWSDAVQRTYILMHVSERGLDALAVPEQQYLIMLILIPLLVRYNSCYY